MQADHLHNTEACGSIRELLFDYSDQDLRREIDSAKMANIEAHLKLCAACRAEYAAIRTAEHALVSAASSLPSSGDLYEGFANKLAQAPAPSGLRLSAIRVMAPALAAAAVALFVFRSHNPATPGMPSHAPDNQHVYMAKRMPAPEAKLPAVAAEQSRPIEQERVAQAPAVSVDADLTGLTVRQSHSLRRSTARARTRITAGTQSLYAALPHSEPAVRTLVVKADSDLPARSLAGPVFDRAKVPAQSFSLVVEDDVRGFQSQSHQQATTSLASATVAANDGVKIEVVSDAE